MCPQMPILHQTVQSYPSPRPRPSALEFLRRHCAFLTRGGLFGKERLGWGMVVPQKMDPIYMVTLRRLMEHRHRTAGRRGPLEIYTYRTEDTPKSFIVRNGLGSSATPHAVPFYLMLVGSATRVPAQLEHLLAQRFAVGRLALDIPEDYHNYARDLVRAECGMVPRRQGVTFLDYTREGSHVVHRMMTLSTEAETRLWVKEMSTHPTGDGGKALTLHLAPNSAARVKAPPHTVDSLEHFNPRGQLVFRFEDTEGEATPFQEERPWRRLLGDPLGSALALVRIGPAAAGVGMSGGLERLLDGETVGAALRRHAGDAAPAPRTDLYHDFRILGDPAAGLFSGSL